MVSYRLFPFSLLIFFSLSLVLSAEDITVEPFFSPDGGCKTAILSSINSQEPEDGTIRVHIFTFTSKPIADALIAAHNRGVEVVCIFDAHAAASRLSVFQYLLNSGITVVTDANHKINHNKVMIFGDNKVITGSYNFTANAETQNAENIVIITSTTVAAAYISDFQTHWAHSRVFAPLKAQSGCGRPPADLRPTHAAVRKTARREAGRRHGRAEGKRSTLAVAVTL
jgi:phosphatidylserine/phosphatidylglycerophosphate/cardiolipin synthase-like enzyme